MREGETQLEVLAMFWCIGIGTSKDDIVNETTDLCGPGKCTYIGATNCPLKHTSMDGRENGGRWRRS